MTIPDYALYGLLVLIPFLYSILSRMAGGGVISLPKLLGRLPEGLISAGTTLAGYLLHTNPALALAQFLTSYFGIETGHGTAYTMGRNPGIAQSGRKQFLSKLVDPICKAFKKPLGGTFYSWLFMGLKGLWIGLAAFPCGIALAVLWPLAYEIGWQCRERKLLNRYGPTEIGEYVSGFFYGLCVSGSILYWLL